MADVDDADDHKVVLNEDNLSSSPQNESGVDTHENVYFQDLPDALIVTNLEECIFDDVNCKVGTCVCFEVEPTCKMLATYEKNLGDIFRVAELQLYCH